MLEERGVDAVVGHGSEAGGHRGTFIGNFENALVGTMALVPQFADSLSVPVIAAGGIMDGRGLAAALVLGAEGVQMGTAFLPCPESGIHPKYKEAVLAARSEETSLTRAFSGKLARGIRNGFMEEIDEQEVPPFPVQNAYKDIRAAAAKVDRIEFLSLWAGQAAGLGRAVPAAEVVEGTVREAAQRLSAIDAQQSWRQSGLSRRMQGEDRDFGPTVKAEARVCPEAPVSVQEHTAHAVEANRVLTRELRQERVTEKG